MNYKNNNNTTILLVDDNALNLKLLQHSLRDQGFHFQTAQNGKLALESIEKQKPELILLDIMMPVMDGYQTLNVIRKNPETKDIPVIFITGLTDSESKVKGLTLGANDFVTKPFNTPELIARVSTQLRLKRLVEEVKEQTEEILNDLKSAQKIQNALLPRVFPSSSVLSFNSLYSPCNQVGGDLYDVFRIDEDHIGLYICDVSGHGVSAAMITVFIKQSIHTILLQEENTKELSPAKILSKINENFINEDFEGFHATISLLIINERTKEFTSSSAGHDKTYISNNKGEVREVGESALAIGWFEHADFIDIKETLHSGDRVTLYTDGVFEALNNADEQWGKKRLLDYISKNHDTPLTEYASNLLKEVEGFCGNKELNDDLAILTFEVQ